LGGYKVQRDAERLFEDATSAEKAGAFIVLIECVPSELANQVTKMLSVPTIGIGAGPHCDGQVLVTNDMLGWNSGYIPKFVRPFANLRNEAMKAVEQYRSQVSSGEFPGIQESFE
jgi:3-methyl-2-oxobutanoate hydroxymethyltransferase